MAANSKDYFRLLRTYGAMDALWFLRDIKSCFLYMAADIIAAFAALGSVWFITIQFDGFGTMTTAEILFMMAYALMVDGVYKIFFINNNICMISRIIGRGQLDHFMIQPVSIPVQILTSGFAPVSGSGILLVGIGFMIYAVQGLGVAISLSFILKLMGSILCSTAIMLSIIYIASTSAFYSPVASEEIAMSAREFLDLKNFPLGGLPALVQIILTTVLPVGLAAWLPSIVLSGQGAIGAASLLPLITAVAVMVTVLLFQKGMNHYAKNGSPRYLGFGHR